MPTPWTDLPSHRSWLEAHGRSLLAFGRRTPIAGGGAAWLGDDGAPLLDKGIQAWITCRTVHVYAIGHLLGIPGSRSVAQVALDGLWGPTAPLRDATHGGWYHVVGADGTPAEGKEAYDHAFVLLAATSASLAGLPGAGDFLAEAGDVVLERFWDVGHGLVADRTDTAFGTVDPYRGLNSNMHMVEAMLAAADVTSDAAWLERAARIAGFVVRQAAVHGWRIPEHYDDQWRPEPEFNRDRPDDPFRPYGATVGHGLEWARLLLHLAAAGERAGVDVGEGLPEAAVALFDRAVIDGWAADGEPGFVYTTDWAGAPVVRARMHWVVAEAIGAAAVLHRQTGAQRYADLYATFWDYADRHVLDHERGSWHHELDPRNRPSGAVWGGKADLYHAFQATLIPRLPLAPSLASAVAAGLLD